MQLTVQLYTLRDSLANDLPGTLRQVKDAGLDYVELAGFYDRSAEEWRQLLDEIGLRASGAHVPIDQIESNVDQVIADAKTLGMKFVIVPWVSGDRYAGGWEAFGRALAPFAQKVKDAGLTLCYHNHDFEYANGDGLAALYATVPADLLQAEIDAAWVQIAGYDPAEVIRSLKGRVPLVHLKDFDPSRTPRWTPAGQGQLDYDAVLAACREAGVQFGGIELDESPGEPIAAVRESVAFLKDKVA